MAEQNEAMYTVGYLSAIEQIREELAKGQPVGETLDRLEAAARRSAERRGIVLADDARTDAERDDDDRRDYLESLHDESPIAGEDDAAGKPDDFYDGGERHSDVW